MKHTMLDASNLVGWLRYKESLYFQSDIRGIYEEIIIHIVTEMREENHGERKES